MRTSLYSILCIVIRLGAVLLFVRTVASLPAAWASLRVWGAPSSSDFVAVRNLLIGFGGASIALSFALWLYPGMLARLAAGAASREVFESPVTPKDIQIVAFSVLGIVFAAEGLLEFFSILLRLGLAADVNGIAFTTLAKRSAASLFVEMFKLCIGLGLTLGARGLAGLLHRLREAGLPPARDDADEADDKSAKD